MPERSRPEKVRRILPEGDPSWAEISEPVLVFLRQGPKTWPEMDAYGAQIRMTPLVFQNALAWLDNRHLVRSYYAENGTMLWVAQSADTFFRPDVPVEKCPEDREKNPRAKGRRKKVRGEEVRREEQLPEQKEPEEPRLHATG